MSRHNDKINGHAATGAAARQAHAGKSESASAKGESGVRNWTNYMVASIRAFFVFVVLTAGCSGVAWAGSTTTTLASSPNPSAAGQAVTLTATVTGTSPTGSVTFMDGTNTLGTGTLDGNGTATLSYTFNTAGTHSLTAVYGGDTNNATSTSGAVNQTVNQTATTTTLASGTNPSALNQAVTLTATVTGASPSGTVTFMDGTTTLGTGTLSSGTATLSYTFNTAGTHSLTAVYGGDTNNATSTSGAVNQTVNQAATTTILTSGTNPSALNQAVTLTATVTGASPTGTVTFMDGTATLGTGTLNAGTATLSFTFNTVGMHSLTAVYGGDTSNATSTSAAVNQTVNQAATTTSLTSGTNPSALNQAVTLTATVTGASPSGTVTFMDGTNTLGTGTLNAGTASLSYTFTSAGAHSLTAVYGGDANNATSTSGAVNQTVNPATTTTALTSGANPSALNQAVTLTATVTGASPTGTVTFMDGTATLGTGTLNAGTASLSYTFNTAGAHSLTAVYGGDTNNATSTSGAVNQTVNQVATTTTLGSGTNPSNAGQAVTLTATVTGASPTGTVTFMDGTNTLGTGTLNAGTASLSYTFTSAGAHSLTAVYGGDANNATSTSGAVNQTVNQVATTTNLGSGTNPSNAGQAVTLTATVTGASPTGTVTFMDGTTTLGTGTLNAGAATLSFTFNTVGMHSLTAVYGGDTSNATSTSAAVSQTVNQAATTTTLASSLNPSKAGQAVTLTATVTGASPTGTVTFMDGTTTLGTGTLSAGRATLSYTFNTAGTHSLTAVYGGDANNTGSTSSAVSQSVGKANATVSMQNPPPVTVGQPVTLTATVTGANPTGTVTFYTNWGNAVLGTAPVDPATGIATLQYTFTSTTYQYDTVSYSGDANNNSYSSPYIWNFPVNKTTPQLTVTTSANPSVVFNPVTLTANLTSGYKLTGTVTFSVYDGSGWTTVGTVSVQASPDGTTATASISYTFTKAYNDMVGVTYSGDVNNSALAPPGISQIVNKVTSTVTLVSGQNPSAPTQPVTFTATVSGHSPTGTVTFYDGTSALGTVNLDANGVASLPQAFSTQGTHNITASYSGDTYNTSSTSTAVAQSVAQATTTTTLSSSANPSPMNGTVTVTATVNGSYAPTGVVTFYDGGTVIGTANFGINGSASYAYTFTSMGVHNLTASYAGDANNLGSTSSVLVQNVDTAGSNTALTTSPNPSVTNQAVTLTATVTGASPTGTVTFMDGTTQLGTGTLNAGTASLSYTFTTAGTHTLTAIYAGDANNSASTSPVTNQGVGTAATVYYIQPDQLNTPRTLTDPSGNVVWQYDNADPFGNNTPNENPSNQGTFHFNLRFPGQYYDTETNLAYNVNRDYDASIGRYVESDPIGLLAGVNTYTYVEGNPVGYIDPRGTQLATAGKVVGLGVTVYCRLNLATCLRIGAAAVASIAAMCHKTDQNAEDTPTTTDTPVTTADNNGNKCEQEWREARQTCRSLIYEQMQQRAGRRKKRSVTGVTGGYTDVEECARGLVSEQCGGNKVER